MKKKEEKICFKDFSKSAKIGVTVFGFLAALGACYTIYAVKTGNTKKIKDSAIGSAVMASTALLTARAERNCIRSERKRQESQYY